MRESEYSPRMRDTSTNTAAEISQSGNLYRQNRPYCIDEDPSLATVTRRMMLVCGVEREQMNQRRMYTTGSRGLETCARYRPVLLQILLVFQLVTPLALLTLSTVCCPGSVALIWSSEFEVNNDSGTEHDFHPEIAAAKGSVHIVGQDFGGGDWDIHYRLFDGTVWQAEEEISIDEAGESQQELRL